MKQPWWKIAWSHFSDILIEHGDSEINPELYVCLSRGRYQLCVKDAIYSFGDKYDNYWDTFSRLNLDDYRDKNILILGFGLGSIPYMLEKKQNFRANFTCVEYDEEIIYLFNKYVADEIKSPLEFIIGDAKIFMETNERKFDMIAMDVFLEDQIPDQFLQVEFIQDLRNSLTDDGLLIWNHLYHHEKDREKADHFFNHNFSLVFENPSFVQTQGNKMMLNKKIVNSQS